MSFCTRCGTQLLNQFNFCPACGNPIAFTPPPQQPHPHYYPQPYPPTPQRNNPISSIALGIVGIVFAWLFALVGHIVSISGIVLGVKEFRDTGKIGGLVLSIFGEACSVLSSIIGMIIFANL